MNNHSSQTPIAETADQPKGMFDRLIAGSIRLRGWIMILVVALIAIGAYSYQKLPIDAVPDITNVQVQINTAAPGYTALESEQRITYLVETAMAGLPDLEHTRSISRYGLSQVTVIFKDGTDIYFARQLISQRLQEVRSQLPANIDPIMAPVSTGLGEIYQWALEAKPGAKKSDGTPYNESDLREIQDWVIRPQLRNVPGVAEVNTIGGQVREYQVTPDMNALSARGLTLAQLKTALEASNNNRGAGFIDQRGEQLTVRVPGQLLTLDDIRNTAISSANGVPIKISDIATVQFGQELRTGAATLDGKETVLGIALMTMGANSRVVAQAVADRMDMVQRTLPEGIVVKTVYNRTVLVDKAIKTVQKNLMEGALLVIAILFMFLGNLRAALITAMVIPLSMLFTLTGMVEQKISANLMSLGALDFGIIIDGAVVIVENCIRRFAHKQEELKRLLTREERFKEVFIAAQEARRPLIFGQLIILVVYLPIFALTGVEAKLFHPMAATVVIALIGAMILSVTFIPAAVALFITGKVQEKENFIMRFVQKIYRPALTVSIRQTPIVLVTAVCLVVLSLLLVPRLGSEFAPTLSEGDFSLQSIRATSTSVDQSVKMQTHLESELKAKFPEIAFVFARTGTAAIASDVMPPNISDGIIIMKPKKDWPNPNLSMDELKAKISAVVDQQVGTISEFSQPIEMRFNELISGVRSDLGIKIFGEDLATLTRTADQVAARLRQVTGATSVKVEQTEGLPLIAVNIDRAAAARYGLSVADIQDTVASAIGGTEAGQILQGDRRFALVIRQSAEARRPEVLANLPLVLADGGTIPLSNVAQVQETTGPSQISREMGKRRVVVTANVENRDLGSFVSDVQAAMNKDIKLPSGYWIEYGGQFENMKSASQRLTIVIPVALAMVLALLYAMFSNVRDSLLVFTGIPFALTGGIVALGLRGIPLSVSAGVGFIALSGVAVLNGLVMLSFIRDLRKQGLGVNDAVWQGAMLRLRPVLMTALVASLGFVPMAIATGTGAEVQRPLATVVIGGIISSTLLTLLVLPVLYRLIYRKEAQLESSEEHVTHPESQQPSTGAHHER
ncbi:efflux RND transporter permease subunit [Aquirhabdus parva]|uniref:CusA/CzcA family heavy metal efflux RND transporter n=1 Tax=Aquirhabdus parva TaxID=2283318 RepID=A0A345P4P8_9GAMM|nr:CusA/CzcA family heavy metal efflux RND transporter [Aquirhabdus parva]AXI02257.1 CusA/CzcA family heavy metal efflux RND transporter [Aquirhabdus parva]